MKKTLITLFSLAAIALPTITSATSIPLDEQGQITGLIFNQSNDAIQVTGIAGIYEVSAHQSVEYTLAVTGNQQVTFTNQYGSCLYYIKKRNIGMAIYNADITSYKGKPNAYLSICDIDYNGVMSIYLTSSSSKK